MTNRNDEQSPAERLLYAVLGLVSDSLKRGSDETLQAAHDIRDWGEPEIEKQAQKLTAFLRRRAWVAGLWIVAAILFAAIDRAPSGLVGLISFIPLVELIRLLIKRPLVIGAGTAFTFEVVAEKVTNKSFHAVRTFFGVIFAIVFTELVLGIYLSLVPVWNSPEKIPIVILVASAIGVLAATGAIFETKSKLVKWGVVILVILLINLTSSFFGNVASKVSTTGKSVAAVTTPATASTVLACAGEPREYYFPEGVTSITVPVKEGCWSGQVITPGDNSQWWVSPPAGVHRIRLLFADGSEGNNFSGVQFAKDKRGIFRLQSEGWEGNVTVRIY